MITDTNTVFLQFNLKNAIIFVLNISGKMTWILAPRSMVTGL